MQDLPEIGTETEFEAVDYIALTADLVSAYISKNSVRPADLGDLIATVHQSLLSLSRPSEPAGEKVEKPTPAQIKMSIAPEGLISFLDGKLYKTLKRHLTGRGLDPHSYRERFGLPRDYPMVATDYAARRSALAKSIGLGRIRLQDEEAAPAGEPVDAPKRRGRPAKAS